MVKLKFWLNPVGLTWSENLLLCQTFSNESFWFAVSYQGYSPRGICLGSRRPWGSFFSWLGLTRSWLGLDLTASASALPHSFCLGLGSVWKVAPGSISHLRERPPTELKCSSSSLNPVKPHTEEWHRSLQPKRTGAQGNLPSVIQFDLKRPNLALLYI